jgi:hypothetical protein
LARPELAPDLRRFIVTNIPSVPYLEAVLLLRAEPAPTWDAAAMARRLYITEAEAGALLEAAVRHRLAFKDGATYHYQPATDELRTMLDRLAQHYAADVVSVANLIHARGQRGARQFADAFRWKPGRKDNT